MMLSIELVPRDIDRLVSEARAVTVRYPQFTWLNIPDIRTLSVRSHEAAAAALQLPLRVVPHIRARDHSLEEGVQILADLASKGVRDALIVTGDRFDQETTVNHVTSVELIRAAAEESLPLKLWAAFDPYRGELRAELDYVQAKMEAGAVGLFTQPFFDVRLAEMCLDQLQGVPTFVGISPVTSEKSRAYWERANRVVFPITFVPTLDHCAKLSAALLEMVEAYQQHAYLMPIRVDALQYLDAVFSHAPALGTVSQ